MSAALPVNSPDGSGGGSPQPETVVLLNAVTWPNADELPPADSIQETPLAVSGPGGQPGENPFSRQPDGGPADEDWGGPVRATEPAEAVAGAETTGAVLPPLEKRADPVADEEIHGPASANGGQPSGRQPGADGDGRQPLDRSSDRADKAAMGPNAVVATGKTVGSVNGAESSGPVSFPAQFPQRTPRPQTLDNRLFPAPRPAERDGPEPQKKSAHQTGPLQQPSTGALQVLPESVSRVSFPPAAAVAGNGAAHKAAEASGKPLDDMLAPGKGPDPLPRSPAVQAPRQNGSTRDAAQPQPTPIRASVLPVTSMVDHHARPAAKAVRRPSVDGFKAPAVKIGQVDVFIEAPQRSANRRLSSPPATLSLASRRYLRRL